MASVPPQSGASTPAGISAGGYHQHLVYLRRAFAGLDKVIRSRSDKGGIGFRRRSKARMAARTSARY